MINFLEFDPFSLLRAEAADDDAGGGSDDKDDNKDNKDDDKEDEDEDDKKDDDWEGIDPKEAKALYKLLKDPATQSVTIRQMAAAAGLLGTQDDKQDVRKDTKTIASILAESLGDEYKFITPKLASAIEKILEEERKQHKTSTLAIESKQASIETDAALDKLASETKGDSRKFEARMSALADEVLPAPGVSTYKYVKQLYTLASAEHSENKSKRELADKINRNSKDAPGRLQTGGGGSSKGGDAAPKGLKNIVAAALEAVSKQK